MLLVKIIKSTGRVLWKQRELPSVTVLFFRSMTSTVVSHKGLAGAAVIGALVLLRVTVPWAEGSIHTSRTFPYTSIGFPVNLSNATARRSFCPCAILSSNYGRGCSSPPSSYWDRAPGFISYSCQQPQVYSQVS